MKLLLPIFASLMIQHQVNAEYFGLKKCLMGLGRCKDHCAVGEKEMEKCKKKKCCIGPKVVETIKNYMQNEMSHTLEGNPQEHRRAAKNSDGAKQTKHRISPVLPRTKSVSPFANVDTLLIPKATTVNSAIAHPTTLWKITYAAISAADDAKESRDSATTIAPAVDTFDTSPGAEGADELMSPSLKPPSSSPSLLAVK